MRKQSKPKLILDEDDLKSKYDRESPFLSRLCGEAKFILEEKLSETDLKIHAIESRVKTFPSFVDKAKRNGYDKPLSQIHDIAGVRVVCLFRDDLARIEQIVRNYFRVISGDNKIAKIEDSLGYQSVHYVCELPTKLKGARYDK